MYQVNSQQGSSQQSNVNQDQRTGNIDSQQLAANNPPAEIGPPPEPQVHKQVLKQVQQQIQNQLQQQAAATNSQLNAINAITPATQLNPSPNLAVNPAANPPSNQPFNAMEVSQGQLGESAMQAFAREMLKDMPVAPASKTGFSQSAKYNETSGVHFPQINVQEALALNPALVPMPSPPQRNGSNEKASYGNALAQRPESQQFEQLDEFEEEPYTAEAIASLTNRSKVNTRSNAKGRRPSKSEQSRIRTGRLLKDFGIPFIAVVVLIGLVLYLFSGKPIKPGAAATTKSTSTVYESPDQKKQLRLLGTEVLIVNPSGATKVPLKRIKSNWGDLFAALSQSVSEKQIWMAENLSVIKSADGINYYLSTGPDSRVFEKMRQLTNYAQAYFLSSGEYPRTIPPGAEFQFAYASPYNGKAMSLQIISDRTSDKDGSDMKLNLEGGVHLGADESSLPGYIGCYGALYNENNILKCTKFFVRGCNRNGRFLTADNDQIFVLAAGSDTVNKTASSPEKKTKAATKNNKKSKKASRQKDSTPVEKPADSSMEPAAEKDLTAVANAKPPEKPTTVYIMTDPVLPLALMHHLVPIFLSLITALCFMRARMVGFDIKGEEIVSGSKGALIAGLIFLCLTALSLFLQFSVFS